MEETKKVEEVKEEATYNEEYDDKTMIEEEFFSQGKKKPRRKRKIIQNLKCPLCEAGVKSVGYKDVYQLKKFTSVRGKIISVEKSGACHKHQKQLKRAIKRARFMALLPYISREV